MDITINKIAMDGMESLKVSEGSAVNQSVASESPRAEEDRRQTVDNQQVKELTENLQGYVDKMNINVAFSTYGEKNKNVSVVVSEKETGKLIREIPPKELQQLHVKMKELAGMILNGIA
ncbi:MAG: flagellar protein FlaG [Desulfobacterales bacterium]|nr:flagellar protein FlaG [Desulfobacterales bacterium]